MNEPTIEGAAHQDWCRWWNHGDFCSCGALESQPVPVEPDVIREKRSLVELHGLGGSDKEIIKHIDALLSRIQVAQQEREECAKDKVDAERYRFLRKQHEFDDDQASNNNYGKNYPPRTMCVFQDDGADGLEPVKCDPGALDEAIDRARSAK